MPASADAFYSHDGDQYESSELTRGPWDPGSQHAGPPAALIGRELELVPAEAPMQIGRITFEILRPVPIGRLRVAAEVVRPGRSVELLEGGLWAGSEQLVRATAWRLRTGSVELPAEFAAGAGAGGEATASSKLRPGYSPRGPDSSPPRDFFPTGEQVGYHTAMDYRFAAGAFLEPGPATVWMRMRHRLVADEEPTPLQRVLVAADSGNGVSAALDWRRYLFINVDLTVHLHRLPDGEWVCLDAITIPERSGVGLADTALYDRSGPIGRAAQTLLVRRRSPVGTGH